MGGGGGKLVSAYFRHIERSMIKVTENNIHIPDSYKTEKKAMRRTLLDIWNKHPECKVFKERSLDSLIREWCVHNALYYLGIARERTKDVDLNIPQKWYEKIGYPVVGCLVWIFIN